METSYSATSDILYLFYLVLILRHRMTIWLTYVYIYIDEYRPFYLVALFVLSVGSDASSVSFR